MNTVISQIITYKNSLNLKTISSSRSISFKELTSNLEISLKTSLCFNLINLSLLSNLEVGTEIILDKKNVNIKIEGVN